MSLFQDSLFKPSSELTIKVNQDHELVTLSQLIDWQALQIEAERIRERKIKKNSGPEPRYRPLLGAVALMATRKTTFRQAEDLVAHYAPARILCDIAEGDWTLDHVSIFEFTQMLGPVGLQEINTQILKTAADHGLLDSSVLMSDTTAQEAMIPYPTEVGLMSRYMTLAQKYVKKLGGKFVATKKSMKDKLKKVKALVRNSHLFAKGKEQKVKVGKKIYHTVKKVHEEIQELLATGRALSSKAGQELTHLSGVMESLLPQILHFLTTGFVASKKIIHLQMDDLYSIVRGKAGKTVEFGLKWGINRIGNGFLQGFLMSGNVADQKFCLEAVKYHQAVFGRAPETFGFDRGGYSKSNMKKIKKLGVKNVGIAPKGKASWLVLEKMQEKIRRERAQVEGCIGTIKSSRYGFNKPNARSTNAMESYGQRAILGFNMKKMMKELTLQQMKAALA